MCWRFTPSPLNKPLPSSPVVWRPWAERNGWRQERVQWAPSTNQGNPYFYRTQGHCRYWEGLVWLKRGCLKSLGWVLVCFLWSRCGRLRCRIFCWLLLSIFWTSLLERHLDRLYVHFESPLWLLLNTICYYSSFDCSTYRLDAW